MKVKMNKVRSVVSAGGKGNSTKTTMASLAADIMSLSKIPWIGLDTDPENATFLRAWGKEQVRSTHLTSAGEANDADIDAFVSTIGEAIERQDKSIIIDIGATQWESVEARLVESGLDEMIATNTIATILFAMSAEDENVNTLRTTLENLPVALRAVPFVVVETLRDGPNRRFHDPANAHTQVVRGIMAERGIRHVQAPAVRTGMHKARTMPFSRFLAPDSDASWAERKYVRDWFNHMVAELQPVIMR